jgi:hypothetical protein
MHRGGARAVSCLADMWSTPDLDEAYLEHLTDLDAATLLAAAGEARGEVQRGARDALRRRGVERVLALPDAAALVLSPPGGREPLVALSPFVVFAVAVHSTTAAISQASYVSEWTGPGRSTPVFDTPRLAEFLADPWRRLFLAELLASYTKVASGSVVVATRRGLRRQRFSELDPVRMAGLLDSVPPAERPGVLRRLGDLSLFLTGVFPDHVARRGFGPIEEGRLLRAGGPGQRRGVATPGGPARVGTSVAASFAGDGGAVGLLDQLGRRWYEGAYRLLPRPVPARTAVIGELPERFGDARRVLNHLTERYLFARRDRLFGRGS